MPKNPTPHADRIEMTCPKCTTRLAFDAAQAGTIQKCLKCGESIQMPKKKPAPPLRDNQAN